jgi:flagellar protein FliO/FliZ
MHVLEFTQLMRFAAALVFVLALMAGLALVMRRLGEGRHTLPPRQRRLKIIETLPLDSRRRLVLLRRDGREHLVILGHNADTVIESGIESPQDEIKEAASS